MSGPAAIAGSVVYVIQGAHGGPVKVGFSESAVGVAARVAGLQCGHPWRLVVRQIRAAPNGIRDERDLHERLAEWRLSGEWFMFTPSVAHILDLGPPKAQDEACRLGPLLDSTFAAGKAAGQREAERRFREDVRRTLAAASELVDTADADGLEESVAERAAREMCDLAGMIYPGRTAHETAHGTAHAQ